MGHGRASAWLAGLILLAGCRGSGVPWRRVEATLSRGARIEIQAKVSLAGTADASVRVESGTEGSATLMFDRESRPAAEPIR